METPEAAPVPKRVAAGTEEIGAHVVVCAVNFPAEAAEVIHNFRTDEAGGTSDEEGHGEKRKLGLLDCGTS